MSLILDALKKADSSKDASGASEDSAPTKTDVQAGYIAPKKAKPAASSSKSRVVLLAVLLIVATLGVAWYAFGPQIQTMIGINLPKIAKTQTAAPAVPQPKKPAQTANQEALIEKQKKDKVDQLQKEARRFFYNGQYNEASKAYEKLTQMLPSKPEVYNNYGIALKKLGNPKEAMRAYSTALALNPNYPEALNNLGVLEVLERNYSNAKKHFSKAIEIDPAYVDPYLHLGVCLEKMGDIAGAINYYQSFLKLSEGKVDRRVRVEIESRILQLKEDV